MVVMFQTCGFRLFKLQRWDFNESLFAVCDTQQRTKQASFSLFGHKRLRHTAKREANLIQFVWSQAPATHSKEQALNLATIVFSALMIWKSLMLVTGSESPVVVVLSGSMEPTMWRGDIWALWMPDTFEVGNIVVFKIKERDIPIIHRVFQTHHKLSSAICTSLRRLTVCTSSENGTFRLLTKGDNNQVDDAYGIYAPGQMWLEREDLMGKAVVYVPQAGFLTIWINEKHMVKVVVIGCMCLYVLFLTTATRTLSWRG